MGDCPLVPNGGLVGPHPIARNGGVPTGGQTGLACNVGGRPAVRNGEMLGDHPLVRNAVEARNKVPTKPARW